MAKLVFNKSLIGMVSLVFYVLAGLPVLAANAELSAAGTSLGHRGRDLIFTLAFSSTPQFSVYTLDNPRRLLVDLGDTSLEHVPSGLAQDIPEISAVRYGIFQPGESRIVLDLAAPMVMESVLAQEDGDAGTRLVIKLVRGSSEQFAKASASSGAALWQGSGQGARVEGGAGLPVIAIDPGHGGVDLGAQRGEIYEKDIVLQIARIFRDVLLEDGRFRVVMTRNSDTFIPLGERVEIARRAGARAFISLHADIVTRGRARGTTVFSLSEAAQDQQALTIATLENRSDVVAGISVEGEDDQFTQVLLQLAHRETDALSNRFADIMAEALWFQNDSEIKSRRMAAGFRVLRAPEIPSVLIELGFMSDEDDLERLQNPKWQHAMAEKLRDGLSAWLQEEDKLRGLLRN